MNRKKMLLKKTLSKVLNLHCHSTGKRPDLTHSVRQEFLILVLPHSNRDLIGIISLSLNWTIEASMNEINIRIYGVHPPIVDSQLSSVWGQWG